MPKQNVERMYEEAQKMIVGEIMTRRVVIASEDDSIETVLEKMLHNEFRHIPVVRGKTPVGIVTFHDLLSLMCSRSPAAAML